MKIRSVVSAIAIVGLFIASFFASAAQECARAI